MITLKPGDKAPIFILKDQNGKKVSLEKFLGKKVALYFYPKDSTSTCTVQACNLRDNFDLLKKKKIVILGISPDDTASHKKFETNHELPFTILSDVDRTVVNEYGVWGEKSLYGNKYMGVHRTTFLINEEGVIEHIITTVKSKEHAAQILKVWGIEDKPKKATTKAK